MIHLNRSRIPALWLAIGLITTTTTTTAAERPTCSFNYRQPRVGDQGTQDVQFEMNLVVTFQQSGQVISTGDRSILRRQRRAMTALDVKDLRVTRAQVAFAESEAMVMENGKATSRTRQPVAGKSYHVARQANEELLVTDEQGNPPSAEEIAIVRSAADAVGRRNPWGEVLHQRTVSVGDTLNVPPPLANTLLGFEETLGEVRRFEMKLVDIRSVDGTQCGVFETVIETDSTLAGGKVLTMRGQFVIDAATCRTVQVQLTCPLDVSETRGPHGGRFTVLGKGTLQVSMRAIRSTKQ
jgi:hypothetical protein